jgi:endoglycosylceramidase
MAQWSNPAGRAGILAKLGDAAMYGRVIDAAQPLFQDFERGRLVPMFQRVTAAIRQVDGNHIIFLETGGASNMGVYSAIEPMIGLTGQRDPQQAYAPHGYDLVTDTPDVATASNGRLELIFRRHHETAGRLAMPMLVGEWGAYYGDNKILPSARFICRQFETMLCGDTYWALEKDFSQQAVFQALCRPYPMAVAGTIASYRADADRHTFDCTWQEAVTPQGESRFYLPASYDPAKAKIRLTPSGRAWRIESAGGDNRYLIVPSLGRAGERHLSVAPRSPLP